MRAPSQTCNGQVGCRLQLPQRPFGECRSTAAPETFSRDTAFSGLGGFGIFRLSLLKMLKLRCNRENVEEGLLELVRLDNALTKNPQGDSRTPASRGCD